MRIKLTKGLFAIVDKADYDRVSKHKWHAEISKDGLRIYARTTIYLGNYRKKNIRLHRFIMDAKLGEFIDHKGGNSTTLDCRRKNLRFINKSGNAANSKISKRNISGFKGVTPHSQTGKWRASVSFNGKRISLGLYSDPDQANKVVQQKRKELWG